jgi:hypothetical protein
VVWYEARRFFRLHKWIDHWGVAQEKFNAQEDDAVLKMLDVTKNGFLGMYFFLEMGTIVSRTKFNLLLISSYCCIGNIVYFC